MATATTGTGPSPRSSYRAWEWVTYAICMAVLIASILGLVRYLYFTLPIEGQWSGAEVEQVPTLVICLFASIIGGLVVSALLSRSRFELRTLWILATSVLLWAVLALGMPTPFHMADVPDGKVRVLTDGSVYTADMAQAVPLARGILTPRSTLLNLNIPSKHTYRLTAELKRGDESFPTTRQYRVSYTITVDPEVLQIWTTTRIAEGYSLQTLREEYQRNIAAVHSGVAAKMVSIGHNEPADVYVFLSGFTATVAVTEQTRKKSIHCKYC